MVTRRRNVGDYITTGQRQRQKLPVSEDIENVFVIDHDFCDTFLAQDKEKLVILPSVRQTCRMCFANVPIMRTREGANERGLYERNATRDSRSPHTDANHTVWLRSDAARTHRLWRLNYQPQSNNSDGSYGSYFSVDDPLDKTMKIDIIHEPAAE
jgi:hypothetical protein